MKKSSIAFACAAFGLAAAFNNPLWVDEDGAKRTLENQGYTEVKAEGYSLFGCGRGDAFRTEFTAKKGDRQIEGVVCKGLFLKGSTVRTFD